MLSFAESLKRVAESLFHLLTALNYRDLNTHIQKLSSPSTIELKIFLKWGFQVLYSQRIKRYPKDTFLLFFTSFLIGFWKSEAIIFAYLVHQLYEAALCRNCYQIEDRIHPKDI